MKANTLDSNQLKANLSDSQIWIRLVVMALFVIMLNIAGVLMWAVCLVQFVFVAATGAKNPKLLSLGSSLGQYIHQVLDFLSFNTEQRPFPFADWPSADSCSHKAEPPCEAQSQAASAADNEGAEQNTQASVIALGSDNSDATQANKTNPPADC